jgi:hypothetical protein
MIAVAKVATISKTINKTQKTIITNLLPIATINRHSNTTITDMVADRAAVTAMVVETVVVGTITTIMAAAATVKGKKI